MKQGKGISTIVTGLFGIMLLVFLIHITVYAGNINGNESSVLAAAKSTFEYNGKKYQAYPSYITTLQNYLNQDDVDLTAEDASVVISALYENVPQGIENQYLYEVSNTESTTESTTEDTADDNMNSSTTENIKDAITKVEHEIIDKKKEDKQEESSANVPSETENQRDISVVEEGQQENFVENGRGVTKENVVEDSLNYADAVEELFFNSKESKQQSGIKGIIIVLIGILVLVLLVLVGRMVILLKKKSDAIPLITECLEQGLTEMHCHIVPGVDDGSKDIETSMKMVDIAYADGIRKIVATPHYIENHLKYNEEKLKKAFEQFKEQVGKKYPDVNCYLGNELYYSSEQSLERLKDGSVHSMAGSKYVLIEFSTRVSYNEMYKAMKNFVQARYYPILAHMERFQCLTKHPERVDELKELGVYFQMNADSVFGKGADKSWCRKMLKTNRIHFLGTDAHGITHRTPKVKSAVVWICEHTDDDYVRDLLINNPRKVLENKHMD